MNATQYLIYYGAKLEIHASTLCRRFSKKHYVIATLSLYLIFILCCFEKVARSPFVASVDPDPAFHAAFELQLDALSIFSDENIQTPIVRENHDSCRDFTFKEISVFHSCDKGDISRANITSRIEKIKRYIPLLGNGCTMVMPDALCLGTSVRSSDITLTNQFSVEKLERLLAQVERWNGPASSTVYIRDTDELITFQSFLLEHLDSLRKVSFHFYIDNARSHSMYSYPNNVLRNIALDNVKTDYFLLIDIDLFTAPSRTHDSMQLFMKENPTIVKKLKEKTVFVLPAFEYPHVMTDNELTSNHSSFPRNKMEIKAMYKNGTIPQFKAFFDSGHGPTDYSKWISDEFDVSYPITFRFEYEPYVIASKKRIPRFYDFFRGYGLNKMSWFTELHCAGYKYEVLRDYFVFHVNHLDSYDKEERIRDGRQNAKCSKPFIERLMHTYGYDDTSGEILEGWKHKYRYGGGDLFLFSYFRHIKW